MAKNSFYEKDNGFDKFISRMEVAAGEQAVMVGYLRSSGTHKPKGRGKGKPIQMAQLAAVHEFGSSDGRIPERSFMRSAVSEGADKIQKLAKKLSLEIVKGKMDKAKALGILGQAMVDMMKAKIAQGVPPPNAPSTVASKGSSKTLIDTGQLMNALEWEVRSGTKK